MRSTETALRLCPPEKGQQIEAIRSRTVRSLQSALRTKYREIRAGFAYFAAKGGAVSLQFRLAGGESGIRTHVTLSSKHAFQACAFSHSAISPVPCERSFLILTVRRIAREPQIPHFIRDDNSGDWLLLLA